MTGDHNAHGEKAHSGFFYIYHVSKSANVNPAARRIKNRQNSDVTFADRSVIAMALQYNYFKRYDRINS